MSGKLLDDVRKAGLGSSFSGAVFKHRLEFIFTAAPELVSPLLVPVAR